MNNSTNLEAHLLEITQNHKPGTELSPYIRSLIVGMSLAGKKPVEIAEKLKLKKSTVSKTIKSFPERHLNQSKPRSGRPNVCSERDKRRILRLVHQNPKITWPALKKALGLEISKRTYQRILAEHKISKWLAKKWPCLTEAYTLQRLAWTIGKKDRTEPCFRRLWSLACRLVESVRQHRMLAWVPSSFMLSLIMSRIGRKGKHLVALRMFTWES
jgi:transposase